MATTDQQTIIKNPGTMSGFFYEEGSMNIWLQIASAVVVVMMLFYMYPAAKHWLQNGPKAKKGDWLSAAIPLLLVVGFVLLLIAMVK
ncbi:hypothetical protein [Thiolapillus sp.]|uniref:hypothetical protein n=1 Tax=Thiolapillus sp. TaxID=2017437 RepID=UPI0025FF06A6|nr:hypothetical protein [Thiolapillus sp.]